MQNTKNPTTIAERYCTVLKQIQHAAAAAQRNANTISLLAVSKTKPISAITELYAAGQRQFGENYVQEGVDKIQRLSHLSDVVWHFIGPLQSNKSKDVAENFAWIHSIDRDKLIRRLNEQRSANMPPLQCLIQVNIDDETSKAGVQLAEIVRLAEQIDQSANLTLRGLMAIPNPQATHEEKVVSFQSLTNAMRELQAKYESVDTLSLGMSDDLEIAIQHGSTMVRIGTTLFGKRVSA